MITITLKNIPRLNNNIKLSFDGRIYDTEPKQLIVVETEPRRLYTDNSRSVERPVLKQLKKRYKARLYTTESIDIDILKEADNVEIKDNNNELYDIDIIDVTRESIAENMYKYVVYIIFEKNQPDELILNEYLTNSALQSLFPPDCALITFELSSIVETQTCDIPLGSLSHNPIKYPNTFLTNLLNVGDTVLLSSVTNNIYFKNMADSVIPFTSMPFRVAAKDLNTIDLLTTEEFNYYDVNYSGGINAEEIKLVFQLPVNVLFEFIYRTKVIPQKTRTTVDASGVNTYYDTHIVELYLNEAEQVKFKQLYEIANKIYFNEQDQTFIFDATNPNEISVEEIVFDFYKIILTLHRNKKPFNQIL